MHTFQLINRFFAILVVGFVLAGITTTTGWTANVQVNAHAQWSEVIATGPDGKQRPRDLQVVVNLTDTRYGAVR